MKYNCNSNKKVWSKIKKLFLFDCFMMPLNSFYNFI